MNSIIVMTMIICGVLSAVIFNSRGRSQVAGFSLGFFLGLIGLLLALMVPT
jgi:hypothetical protein